MQFAIAVVQFQSAHYRRTDRRIGIHTRNSQLDLNKSCRHLTSTRSTPVIESVLVTGFATIQLHSLVK